MSKNQRVVFDVAQGTTDTPDGFTRIVNPKDGKGMDALLQLIEGIKGDDHPGTATVKTIIRTERLEKGDYFSLMALVAVTYEGKGAPTPEDHQNDLYLLEMSPAGESSYLVTSSNLGLYNVVRACLEIPDKPRPSKVTAITPKTDVCH